MTKLKQKHQELIEQAEALLAKAKEMEPLIEEEQPSTDSSSEEIFGILSFVEAGSDHYDDGWYYVGQYLTGEWGALRETGIGTHPVFSHPVFSTEESAAAWADAFQVMMELRCCEGAIAFQEEDGVDISLDTCAGNLTVCDVYSECSYGGISPMFSSEDYAQEAIDKVGKERIIRAIKTISGVK